jgi:hypothetical protein
MPKNKVAIAGQETTSLYPKNTDIKDILSPS